MVVTFCGTAGEMTDTASSLQPLPGQSSERSSLPSGTNNHTTLIDNSILYCRTGAMSAYTSTHEGFQRAMKWSLTGPPEEAKLYVEGTATPQFFHIFNGKRLSLVEYVQVIEEWRGKIDEYQPVV